MAKLEIENGGQHIYTSKNTWRCLCRKTYISVGNGVHTRNCRQRVIQEAGEASAKYRYPLDSICSISWYSCHHSWFSFWWFVFACCELDGLKIPSTIDTFGVQTEHLWVGLRLILKRVLTNGTEAAIQVTSWSRVRVSKFRVAESYWVNNYCASWESVPTPMIIMRTNLALSFFTGLSRGWNVVA